MMDRFRCAICGEEHSLAELEPSYHRPDAYFAVPSTEREHRTNFADSEGRIREADDSERRHFLRVVMPVPIRGAEQACGWGVWVEVSEWAWNRTRGLWDEPNQDKEPPFPGVLANGLKGYADTLGLPGTVRLTSPTTVPEFTLNPELEHPLARDQREGMYLERVLEWRSPKSTNRDQ